MQQTRPRYHKRLSLHNLYIKSSLPCSLCGCFVLFVWQAAKEEEEKVEDGMWEETFKSHSDSKPNGTLQCSGFYS